MVKTTFRNGNNLKWAYVGEVYGNGRKYGYYVASGRSTTNYPTKTFKIKSKAISYARSIITQ